MHPQLIPEKHPMCGKYMEALVKCREANPVMRYWGECNEITYQLSKCLVEEKKEFRAPRQAKFQERWAKKKADDAARMEALEKAQEERRRARELEEAAAAGAGTSLSTVEAGKQ